MYQQPRAVKLRTKFEILKQRPLQLWIGLYLVGFSTFFFLMATVVSTTFEDENVPKVDYEEVKAKGKLVTGKITGIEVKENVTINDKHPAVIFYAYPGDAGTVKSSYEVLDPKNVARMEAGDPIQIRYLANESILDEYKPHRFDIWWIFALMPLIIIGIGLIFLLPAIISYRRILELYRTGQVREAELVSMMPQSGFSMFSSFGQRILVHYKYPNSLGQNVLGESLTTDFSILNEKKQGEMVRIFVSRRNDSTSCLVPKLETIRNDWKLDV